MSIGKAMAARLCPPLFLRVIFNLCTQLELCRRLEVDHAMNWGLFSCGFHEDPSVRSFVRIVDFIRTGLYTGL